MANMTRRSFTRGAALAVGGMSGSLTIGRGALGDPLGFPVGLELYTVKDDLQKDFEGTMRKVAEIGYRQIETNLSIGGRNAKQIAEFANGLGLGWRSVHTSIPELQSNAGKIIEQCHDIGIENVICAAPWVRDPSKIKKLEPSDPLVKEYGQYASFVAALNSMTLDDWKFVAEFFNKIGEQVHKAGMVFGYHNHNFEFKKFGEVLPYDELIKTTDPQYVSFELDCGWMASAGYDPAAYLEMHPKRYRLLHIKDLAKGQATGGAKTTEVGSGAIDWKKILAAAQKASVTGYYVEQEPPYERPPLESAKISYDYLHALKV